MLRSAIPTGIRGTFPWPKMMPGLYKACSSTATHIVVCLQQLTVHEQVLLQILEGIVPGLLRKKEEEEKRLRVAQRMQRQMDNIMLDENGGFGRCALCP